MEITKFLSILSNYIITLAPYLILGLLVAGFVHVFISSERIKKSFGSKGLSGVLKASLFGIPLPLCSCAVIPSAITLKKNGASNASTSAFLISTPESGVDSIMVTYAMMGLPMAIIRPVTAFISAFFAGVLQLMFNPDIDVSKEPAQSDKFTSSCCTKKACGTTQRTSFASKIAKMIKFSFIELIDDMAGWLFIGILAGALIEFFVPVNAFESLNAFSGRLIILAIGVPLYICASASTPIAASLMLKGMSPGMALLFLSVGPATNISNIFVLNKYIGKKGVAINIFAISVVALLMSFVVDYFLDSMNFNISNELIHQHIENRSWLEIALSVFFSVLLLKSLIKIEVPKLAKKLFAKKDHTGCCG